MSEMLDDSTLKSNIKNHAHRIGKDQFIYNDYLAKAGGFETLPAFYKLGFEIWFKQRKQNLNHYKHLNLVPTASYNAFTIVDTRQTSN
jgi:hypothetical protein